MGSFAWLAGFAAGAQQLVTGGDREQRPGIGRKRGQTAQSQRGHRRPLADVLVGVTLSPDYPRTPGKPGSSFIT
jgi:hypothetical protein